MELAELMKWAKIIFEPVAIFNGKTLCPYKSIENRHFRNDLKIMLKKLLTNYFLC